MRRPNPLMSFVAASFAIAALMVPGCMFDPGGNVANPTGSSGSAGSGNPTQPEPVPVPVEGPEECFSDSNYANCERQDCIDQGYGCFPAADGWQLWVVGDDTEHMPTSDENGIMKGGERNNASLSCPLCECVTTKEAQCNLPAIMCWRNETCQGSKAFTWTTNDPCVNAPLDLKSCKVSSSLNAVTRAICDVKSSSFDPDLGPLFLNETSVYVVEESFADGDSREGCAEGKVCKLMPLVESIGENQLCVAKSSVTSLECPTGWQDKRYAASFYIEKGVSGKRACPTKCICSSNPDYEVKCNDAVNSTFFTAYDDKNCKEYPPSVFYSPSIKLDVNSKCENVTDLVDSNTFSIGRTLSLVGDVPSCKGKFEDTEQQVEYGDPWTVCCLE